LEQGLFLMVKNDEPEVDWNDKLCLDRICFSVSRLLAVAKKISLLQQ